MLILISHKFLKLAEIVNVRGFQPNVRCLNMMLRSYSEEFSKFQL